MFKYIKQSNKSFTLTPLDNSASQNRFIRFFKKNLINLSNGVNRTKSFTLIELLIVIAILALLMSIIIITLNPSELLKQTRDTKRISSLKALNNALGIFQATKPTTNMGTSSIVYISIPDSSSACANLSLPTLPTGYEYRCSSSTNYKKTDGTGWIPVNFDSLDIGSPLSSLPIDPTNTTSTNLFYTYSTGGSWELNAILESSKQKLSGGDDKTSVDGGDSYSTYEIGTDLSLAPYKDTGLVGYWKFDDASGTTAVDSSGYNNTGTLTNGPTWKTQTDCKRGGCLQFSSVAGNYIDCGTNSVLLGDVYTISFWIKTNGGDANVVVYWNANGRGIRVPHADNRPIIYLGSGNFRYFSSTPSAIDNSWHHVVAIITGNNQTDINNSSMYLDGSSLSVAWGSSDTTTDAKTLFQIARGGFNGYLDDIRIYNRVLSEAEVKALYEGTK
jgi:prepilin-type N-terminal cleavage/methylation domain-containing protein